jgi:hypothetical protein
MASTPSAATVEAYACVDNSSGNGFTLPLLRTGGEGPWLVQQADESTDRVIAFKFVDGDLASIEPAPDPVDVRIGEPQIYAFIEGNNLYLGPKSVIEPSLRSFVLANPAELATAVQVFRIIGTVYEKRRARTQMKNLIEKCTGAAAANSFVMSDLAGAFWTKLSAAWFLSDDPERGHLLRSQFRVSIINENIVHVANVEPQEDREQASLKQIMSELQVEFGAHETNVEPFRDEGDFVEDRPTILHGSPRQEERIALIIVWLLQDYEGLSDFFNAYRPTPRFEQQSMAILGGLYKQGEWPSASFANRQVMVSQTIVSLYKMCFPMNRGHFIALMSKHLGRFSTINQTLQQIFLGTRSMFVREHQFEIRRYLGIM